MAQCDYPENAHTNAAAKMLFLPVRIAQAQDAYNAIKQVRQTYAKPMREKMGWPV